MASSVIAIVGSTGSIGAATLRYLSDVSPAGTIIRAGVRDTASAAAAAIAALPKVTVVKASMADPASMAALFAGASVALVNTPGDADRTTLALAGIAAARAAHVAHVVVVSVLSAEAEATTFGRQFAPIEAAVKTGYVCALAT